MQEAITFIVTSAFSLCDFVFALASLRIFSGVI
jgi:hypothetical protein